jgi:hypothetical protein
MGSIDLLTAQAGTRAQAPPALLAGRHGRADRGQRGCRLCPYQLPYRRYSPCKDSPAPDLPRRLATGDCLMGVQLGLMITWASLRGCGCNAGTAGAAAGGCHCAPPMIKRSEAAAEVRPGPAAPFRLTALVISAGHARGPAGWTGAAASFRLRIAGPAGPFVLAWTGDRSPIRGCTTTGGDRVGHVNSPYSPVSGHARSSPAPGLRLQQVLCLMAVLLPGFLMPVGC